MPHSNDHGQTADLEMKSEREKRETALVDTVMQKKKNIFATLKDSYILESPSDRGRVNKTQRARKPSHADTRRM